MICLVYFLTVDAKSDIETYPVTPTVTPVSSSVPFVVSEHPDLDADSLRTEMYELNRREDTQPPSPAQVAAPENPYAAIVLTEEEYILLAGTAYNESRGEPYAGQVAVIEVVLNRYLHPDFKGTIKDIVTAPNQFAYGYKYTDMQMQAVKDALAGYGALDFNINVVWFSTGSLTYGSLYKTICCHEFRAIDAA